MKDESDGDDAKTELTVYKPREVRAEHVTADNLANCTLGRLL